MKRYALLHPFLFTILSLLFIYEKAAVLVPVSEILRPLIVLWFILLLLLYPFYKLSKDWYVTGFLMTIFVFGFYYSEPVFILVVSIIVITLVFWAMYSFLKKRAFDKMQASVLLLLLSSTLVLVQMYRIRPAFYNMFDANRLKSELGDETVPDPGNVLVGNQPNIYYIVLDGYAQDDVLNDLYDFDNTAFINELASKGFIIPADNHSNYPKTLLSIPSTLNMDYIPNIAPELRDSNQWWRMTAYIEDSKVQEILKSKGYQTISISVNWELTDNQRSDIHYQPRSVVLNGFEHFIFALTPLQIFKPLLSKVVFLSSYESHRELVLYNFNVLSQIPYLGNGYFVYSHIISPHPPFVFEKNGLPIDPNHSFGFFDANEYYGTKKQYRDSYVEQVQFVNQKIMDTVDTILANSTVPPIIILQADHGPGMLTDFRSSKDTCLQERFSPFAAYYLPDLDKSVIPADITPVNLFRVVLNQYFDTDFEMLSNYYYYNEDSIFLFRFEELSLAQLEAACQ